MNTQIGQLLFVRFDGWSFQACQEKLKRIFTERTIKYSYISKSISNICNNAKKHLVWQTSFFFSESNTFHFISCDIQIDHIHALKYFGTCYFCFNSRTCQFILDIDVCFKFIFKSGKCGGKTSLTLQLILHRL